MGLRFELLDREERLTGYVQEREPTVSRRLSRLASEDFPLLASIDAYSTTVLDRERIVAAIGEIERLMPGLRSSREAALFRELLALLTQARDTSDSRVVVQGD